MRPDDIREDWLERMREERAEAELERLRAEEAAKRAPRPCCQGYDRGIGHDGTCPERFSRSAGS